MKMHSIPLSLRLEYKDLQERHSKQMHYQLIKIKKHLILSSHLRKF